MSSEHQNQRFKFDSPEGWELCRQILTTRLPFSPHDYQLAGVTALLDRKDFIGVSATGSGKSGFVYMTLHVILAILEKPELCPTAKFPKNPAFLVIYPTKALEEDQAQKFAKLGLTAVAINGDTIDEARHSGVDLWKKAESAMSLILISPEMLTTRGFQSLVDSEVFRLRLFAMGPDEIHLLCSWGLEFRKSYQHIPSVRKRFRDDVVLFGMTATLRKGAHTKSVCDFLGLRDGNYKFLRCSNARPDIRLAFRTLHATDSSESFPDLDWLLTEPGKTLIFCPSIHFGFKILVYLWYLMPKRSDQRTTLHMYNALNSADHNRQVFQLMQGESGPNEVQITIATDKLSVGVDVPDFRTVVILNPVSLDDLWQKAGRVGRDKTKIKDAQVFVYFPKSVFDNALGQTGNVKPGGKKVATANAAHGSKQEISADRSLQAVITAACRTAEINEQYENLSAAYPPCSRACLACPSLPPPLPSNIVCKCDLCLPDTAMSSPPKPQVNPRKKPLPLSIRITTEMRELAAKRLRKFRQTCWAGADERTTGMIPMESYLPDSMINNLITLLPTFYTPAILESSLGTDDSGTTINNLMKPFTAQSKDVAIHSREFVELLLDLHRQFDEIRERIREEQRVKRAEVRLRKSESHVNSESAGAEDDEELDGSDVVSEGEYDEDDDEKSSQGRPKIMLRIDPRRVSIPGFSSVTIESV